MREIAMRILIRPSAGWRIEQRRADAGTEILLAGKQLSAVSG
jgi:hypothetical protein